MSACVDLVSSNVSVNKEVMKLCARVLEYDLQYWMLYGQLPQELKVSLAMGAQDYVYQTTRTIIFLLLHFHE